VSVPQDVLAAPAPPVDGTTALVGIRAYPVKSLGGVALSTSPVRRWGLGDDRRWTVVDEHGQRLRPKRVPSMLGIVAAPRPDGGLLLSAPGAPDLTVAPPSPGGPPVAVDVYGLERATGVDPAVDAWLSGVLGRPVRLVWLDDPARRAMPAAHGGRAGDPLSLADLAPILLTSAASLRRLDEWVAAGAAERGEPAPPPLDMRRFRPNLVVDGGAPFAEETWTRLRVGEVAFRLAEHCDRCAVTLVDPDTLARGAEPLRTLARHRRRGGKVWFGIRVVPEQAGVVRLGDPVTVW
jgi:uncharacterized protein YcbX